MIVAVNDLPVVIVASSAGAGLTYALLKGNLAQLKSWKDVIVSYQKRNNELEALNSKKDGIIDELHDTITQCRHEIAVCEQERALQAQLIENLQASVLENTNRIEELRNHFEQS